MAKSVSGYGMVGTGYTGDERGVAYERSKEPSEFGLPENYSDPDDYRPKSPPSDMVIGP